ncbi:MAG: hypothetical protein GY703_13795 [Gammaproteobacteria bacterium]|nr:hypothetical protein [Gammaproteobacteria bacterium]
MSGRIPQESQNHTEASGRDAYKSVGGMLRRYIGSLPSLLMLFIAILIGIFMFSVSPILGLCYMAALIYFRKGLDR